MPAYGKTGRVAGPDGCNSVFGQMCAKWTSIPHLLLCLEGEAD